MVGRLLNWYGTEKAVDAADPARIGHAIDALWPFWETKLLSEIGAKNIGDYAKWRAKQPSKNYLTALGAWERRKAKAAGRSAQITPKPEFRGIGPRTIRTELEYLRAAVSYCRAQVYISDAPVMELPARGQGREEWLSRSEYARLLLAARERVLSNPDARRHLIVYLKVGVYQPARKGAILTLPLVQPAGGGAWLDAKRGIIDFGPGTGNKKRPRQVPIHPRILVYVRAAARRGQKYLVQYRGKRRNDATGKKPIVRPLLDVKHSFANAVKRAKLGKRVTPHTLRHSGVTWLKQTGLDSWLVGRYAGMTPETVDRIYAHSHPDHMKSVTDALTSKRR